MAPGFDIDERPAAAAATTYIDTARHTDSMNNGKIDILALSAAGGHRPFKAVLRHGLLAVVAFMGLSSCSGMIFDDEGDCNPYYKVRFRYDMNLKFADAFRNEVNAVTLYAVDGHGNIVWTRSESGAASRPTVT